MRKQIIHILHFKRSNELCVFKFRGTTRRNMKKKIYVPILCKNDPSNLLQLFFMFLIASTNFRVKYFQKAWMSILFLHFFSLAILIRKINKASSQRIWTIFLFSFLVVSKTRKEQLYFRHIFLKCFLSLLIHTYMYIHKHKCIHRQHIEISGAFL